MKYAKGAAQLLFVFILLLLFSCGLTANSKPSSTSIVDPPLMETSMEPTIEAPQTITGESIIDTDTAGNDTNEKTSGALVHVEDDADPVEVFFELLIEGDTDKVESFIKNHKHLINEKNFRDIAPIHYAIESGKEDLVKLLIKYGVDLKLPNEIGAPPLHLAVGRGKKKIVLIILDAGIDVNFRGKHNITPVQLAILTKQNDIAKLLIKRGADINSKDIQGITPLLATILSNNIEMAKILLDEGADINHIDTFGESPLSFAQQKGRKEIEKMLIEKNALMPSEIKKQKGSLYDKLSHKKPNEQELEKAVNLLGKASILGKEKKHTEALKLLDEAVVLAPHTSEIWLLRGMLLNITGNTYEARDSINTVLKLDPENIIALEVAGFIAMQSNNDLQALEYFDKALAIEPDSIKMLNNKSITLINLERYKEAEECLLKALEIDPANEFANMNLINFYADRGHLYKLIQRVDKYIELVPDSYEVSFNTAVLMRSKMRFEDSLKYFKKALEVKPNDRVALSESSTVLAMLGRNEEALEILDRLTKLYPKHPVAWGNKANVLKIMGRYDEALECLKVCARLYPKDGMSYYLMGLIYLEKDEKEEAEKHFKKSMDLGVPMAEDELNKLKNK